MKKAIVAIGAFSVIIGGLLIALSRVYIPKTGSQSYQILGMIALLVGIGLIIYGVVRRGTTRALKK